VKRFDLRMLVYLYENTLAEGMGMWAGKKPRCDFSIVWYHMMDFDTCGFFLLICQFQGCTSKNLEAG